MAPVLASRMARPLRLEFPGALYHVTTRGNAQQAILLDDRDRRRFLETLAQVVEDFGWLCHAYCLMDNHYHLLIETPRANLSRGMRQLNGLTTQRFNRRHGRVGHLYQGRYKAILVEKERHLLELGRYLVLNPVRAGRVRRPGRYRWSSYRATAGETPAPAFLTTDWLLAQFAKRRATAHRKYRAFVDDGIGAPGPWDQLRGQALLGGDAFVARLGPLLAGRRGAAEIPRRARLLDRPSLSRLLPRGGPADRARRDAAIAEAHVTHGYSLTEIGRRCGLHYSTISRIVAKTRAADA